MSNYAIWGLLGPATWPAWLTVGALVASRVPRAHNASGPLLIGSVATFLLLAIVPSGDWLARPLETRFALQSRHKLSPDHILVLAGAENLDGSSISGRPELNAASERLFEGAALARLYPNSKLWIVGGVRRTGAADVNVAVALWRDIGIPPERIGRIDHTLDTCQNALGVAAAQLRGELVLITSALHMPRAVACFQTHHVSVTPYPVDYSIGSAGSPPPKSALANLRRTDAALHEWIGLAVYRLSGRTDRLLPQ